MPKFKLNIDPARTRAIVLTWPDHAITWEAAAWLYNILPPENVLALCANGQLRDPLRHPEQFKDSPLGRIPREWDHPPLIEVVAAVFDYRGRTPLKLGMEWGGGRIQALSANNVEMGRINWEKEAWTSGAPHPFRVNGRPA